MRHKKKKRKKKWDLGRWEEHNKSKGCGRFD
jgi:hypothetical protein